MGNSNFVPPPTVRVGGKPYQINYGNGAFFLLSTWGIDVTRVAETLNDKFQGGHYTEAMYKLAAAGLGTMDAEGNWRTAGMDPLKMADALAEDEAGPLLEEVWKAFAGKLGLVTTKAAKQESGPKPLTLDSGLTSGPSLPANTDSA